MEASDIVSKVVKDLHVSNNEDFNISVVISIAMGSDFIFSNNKNQPGPNLCAIRFILKYFNRDARVLLSEYLLKNYGFILPF